MSDPQPIQKPVGEFISVARDAVLYRDLAAINERTSRQLGPLPRGGLTTQVKKNPYFSTHPVPRIAQQHISSEVIPWISRPQQQP
jgi:hypothetical protein